MQAIAESSTPRLSNRDSAQHNPATLLRLRLRQRAFWNVQIAVIAIALLYYLTGEGSRTGLSARIHPAVPSLFVFPICYAAIRYGHEGAIFTSLSCVILALVGGAALRPEVNTPAELLELGAGCLVGLITARSTEHERDLLVRAERLTKQTQHVNGLIIRAQEEERLRIARDLHDDVVQRLVHLCLRLDAAIHSSLTRAEIHATLGSVREEAEEIGGAVRGFSRDLRPPILDDLGLVAAIESLTSDVARAAGMPVAFHAVGRPTRRAREIELVFFRICQEALTNVRRHAVARTAEVTLEFAPQMLRLTVQDDGRGFALPAAAADMTADGKLGIAGMAERAELIDAEFSISSAPGMGTLISVVLEEEE